MTYSERELEFTFAKNATGGLLCSCRGWIHSLRGSMQLGKGKISSRNDVLVAIVRSNVGLSRESRKVTKIPYQTDAISLVILLYL